MVATWLFHKDEIVDIAQCAGILLSFFPAKLRGGFIRQAGIQVQELGARVRDFVSRIAATFASPYVMRLLIFDNHMLQSVLLSNGTSNSSTASW